MAHLSLSRQLWGQYTNLLITRPLITKGLTGGFLFATGDLLAQYLDGTLQSDEGYNPKRSAIGFCWSALVFTPIAHPWYSKFLPRLFPTTSTQHTLSKVALDQTLFAGFINSLYLAYSTTAHAGEINPGMVKNKWDAEFINVFKANLMIWPAVQMITFKLIPVPLQMPFMNVVVLFWSCYLATVSAKHHQHPEIPMDTITHAAEAIEIDHPAHHHHDITKHHHSSFANVKNHE